MVEIVANMHMHTPYSDGEKYHREIADAASRAGIDVIIVTDHNVYVRGLEGYTSGVLVLVGEEVHDVRRRPQANHCLIYNANDELATYAANPQTLIHEVEKRGGVSFFAHPFEYAGRISSDLIAIPWLDWNVQHFTGIEIWNYMTELKASMWSWSAAIFNVFFPSLVIRGPFKVTLRQWDELLASGRRIVAIGNSDAHGTPYRLGPVKRIVLPYGYLFKCVNTHLLIDKPLTRNLEADRKMVYDALRAGRCFVGYDLAGLTNGFGFTAQSGMDRAAMGEELPRRAATRFEINCPGVGTIRLLRNGKVVASKLGRRLEYTSIEPGVYRVEVYRFFRLANRGWIFSNPIYVR